jgi:hypothetical protein
VLICSERKVLVAGGWFSERKVLLADKPNEQGDNCLFFLNNISVLLLSFKTNECFCYLLKQMRT